MKLNIGTAIAAGALALSLPVIASAQDTMPSSTEAAPPAAQDTMPSSTEAAPPAAQDTMPSSPDVTPPAVGTQASGLDQLNSLGFLGESQVHVQRVDPSDASAFEPLSMDALNGSLDRVQISAADMNTSSLRDYISSQGIDPATIVNVSVMDSTVVIQHT